jgi:nucleoid DNA-binding protein
VFGNNQLKLQKMPAENIVSSIMDTIAENLPNKKSVRFDEGGGGSVADQAERVFGGRRNLHHVFGGGKRTSVDFVIHP